MLLLIIQFVCSLSGGCQESGGCLECVPRVLKRCPLVVLKVRVIGGSLMSEGCLESVAKGCLKMRPKIFLA